MEQKSVFVTVLAWIFIILSGTGMLMLVSAGIRQAGGCLGDIIGMELEPFYDLKTL